MLTIFSSLELLFQHFKSLQENSAFARTLQISELSFKLNTQLCAIRTELFTESSAKINSIYKFIVDFYRIYSLKMWLVNIAFRISFSKKTLFSLAFPNGNGLQINSNIGDENLISNRISRVPVISTWTS